MKKMLLTALLLATMTWASAQSERVTRLQGSRNLIVTTTDGHAAYHTTSAAQSLIIRKEGDKLVFDGQPIAMSDIQKMRLVTPQKYILNEDSTTFTPMEVDRGLLALRYDFQLNKWNTLVLPVSLTGEQVIEAFGEGTQLAVYMGATENEWAQIDFDFIDLNTTETVVNPDKYYIIRPTREPDIAVGQTTNVYYGTTRVPGPAYIIYNVSMVKNKDFPANQSLSSTERNLGMRVSGAYKSQKVSYLNRVFFCMNDNGLFYEANDSVEMKAFHNWMVLVRNNNNLPFRFYINGIDEDLTLASIEGLTVSDGQTIPDASIYDLSGRRLGTRQSLNGRLPRGIYISNGKKIMVR